jgi:molybdenum cofactor synthesis domain-containing protein
MAAPSTLKIAGESAAGKGWHQKLKKGEAVRIMTGARVPTGADAVQRVELTSDAGFESKSGSVTILEPVKPGTCIVRMGSEIKKGRPVLRPGELITPNNIASIAAFGYAKVLVSKRPRVAILATGSEIVPIAKKPRRDQIRNSNSLMLSSLAASAGAECELFEPAADDLSNLKIQISNSAKRKDVLVITGGVSVGKYDLTKAALEELGATIFFDKLKLKPGKPAVFARLGKTLVFALPGNPVSAAVTFYLLVRTVLFEMQSASVSQLKSGTALLATDAKAARDRDTFLPATLSPKSDGGLVATSLRSQGSSDLVGFAKADSLIYVKAGQNLLKGDAVEIRYL